MMKKAGIVTMTLLLAACGGGGSAGKGTGGDTAAGGTGPGRDGLDGPAPSDDLGGAAGGSAGAGPVCAAEVTEAQLRPVYLAFAFDVSGSMGKGDYAYHDRELKWDPVVAATQSFFESSGSVALSASLTFFPAAKDRCDHEIYASPDVPMTSLPSGAFREAIAAVTPQSADDWRGGTPTLAVVQGTLSFLKPQTEEDPSSIYALVLVTDGHPQGCKDDDDDIDRVAELVAAASPRIPTYVIGVENPPGGPDTVSDLHAIAAAGGTERAFLIETGDPDQTRRDFEGVIEAIRGRSVSCDVTIPPPPSGQTFDPGMVNVTYEVTDTHQSFSHDQSCQHPDSWRYDDPSDPTTIQLCPETCALAQGTTEATLLVEFGCASRVPVVR